MRRESLFVRRALLVCVFSAFGAASISANTAHPLRLPLVFEPNRGQADRSADFLAHASGGDVLIQKNGAVLSGSDPRTRAGIFFVGSRASVPRAESPTGGFANYYASRDARRWLPHIPFFSRVRYSGIYPAIDAVFYGSEGRLEYDFDVAPGGRPSDIEFKIDADKVSLAPDGSLDIESHQQTWRLLRPAAYQLRAGTRVAVAASYRLSQDHIVSLSVGAYETSSTLIIDPVVESSFFLPASTLNGIAAIKLDANRNIILAGSGTFKAGVVKLNPAGTSILYSTLIGSANTMGAYPSNATSLALDPQGNAYIAGNTTAPDFPVTSSNLGSCSTECFSGVGFVAKIGTDGSIGYSTELGSLSDIPRGIAVDAAGSAYVAGSTQDPDFQTVNAFQPSSSGPGCSMCGGGFFAKLNPQGTGFMFASYFVGGSSGDMLVDAIALDPAGNILLAGETDVDPPLMNPWQSGAGGLFLSKFAPDGKTLLFSTRFGSSGLGDSAAPGAELLTGMSIGSDGAIYLVGTTQGQDFPFSIDSNGQKTIPDSYPNEAIFAVAIDPALSKLKYSTFVGVGFAQALALDALGDLYIAATSSQLLSLENAIASDIATGGFYLELDPNGNPLAASEIGGYYSAASLTSIAVDANGDIYLAGAGAIALEQMRQPFFFPAQQDPILVGPGLGNNSQGALLTVISPGNTPQFSLSTTVGPFLALRNVSSVDLHISSIALGGSLSNLFGNCGPTLPTATGCILTVLDSSNIPDKGTVTITSDAQPSVQTFNIASPGPNRPPIEDQLWIPNSIFFYPPQLQATTTDPMPLTVWNVGAANATLNSITAAGSLSETDNCQASASGGAILVPGASCTLELSLTPAGEPNPPQPNLTFTYDGSKTENGFSFYVQGADNPNLPSPNQLLLSSQAINFGTQQVGGVAIPRIVGATNTGDTPLAAPAASIQGDPEFSINGNTCTSILTPHESCAVSVQFMPALTEAPSATLNISGQSVSLSAGGAIASAVQPSPLELDFPPVIYGVSLSLSMQLNNTSPSSVGIASVSPSLADYGASNNCSNLIPALGSCTLTVTFTPQQIGQRNATLSVAFSGGVQTQVIALTGTGTLPFVIQPPPPDFGYSTPVGMTSSSLPIEIDYNGTTPLAYTVSTTGDFSVVPGPGPYGNCSNPVPAHWGCPIYVAFAPQTPGPQQGSLTISYPGIPYSSVVTLTGSTPGVNPNINVPSALTFSATLVGLTQQQSIAISNTGNFNLALSAISLSGANSTDFLIASGQCSSVAAAASCPLQIVFAPLTSGQRTATLTIAGNAPDSPQSVTLTGTALSPGISVPATLLFREQAVATSVQQGLTISNTGNAPVIITAASLAGANASDFQASIGSCASIAAGTSCTMQIAFTPGAIGARSATLTIASNASTGPQTVAIDGTGVMLFIVQPASGASSAVVTAGSTATYNISVSSSPGFAGTVQFSCGGAPQLATCSVQPASVNFSTSQSANLIVTVTTTGSSSAMLIPNAAWLAAFCLPVFFVSRKKLRIALLGSLLLVCCFAVSCGGGSQTESSGGSSTGTSTGTGSTSSTRTPDGTYTLSLTATSGTETQTVPLTLTVQ